MTDGEEFFFSEFWTHDLETDGESERRVIGWCGVARWDGHTGDTSEGTGDGENIGHVVCERIVVHLTDFPCDHRRDGRSDDVDFGKCFCEFTTDEFADERGSVVVGIIKS